MSSDATDDIYIPRLPVNTESVDFNDWKIAYHQSHILKSICSNEGKCIANTEVCCDLCHFRFALELPSLPDMVFHKNRLVLEYKNGALLEFTPMAALKQVGNTKFDLKVACAEEWRESRSEENMEEKIKPFDWTFSTDYQGTMNRKLRVEPTHLKIDITKLMKREKILFYHDLTLFEDELHDNGVAKCSVKVRVMPSGFYVLLRFFLRVDNVLIRINDTRFYFEVGLNYIIKEYTSREAKVSELKHIPPPFFIEPNDIEKHLPVILKTHEQIFFED